MLTDDDEVEPVPHVTRDAWCGWACWCWDAWNAVHALSPVVELMETIMQGRCDAGRDYKLAKKSTGSGKWMFSEAKVTGKW